ncbi:phosphoglucosamine mutase [Pelagicoccus albus]|uniref:Phosphoglucosamine mutase n=1 Tax=Pelagicoccus albus TaxID=415222 RepID=A0A7X1B8K7_9BACT|nr:phosphoglucosamine mutase [Pelagicoccus albus]MBC2607658.1 phosphoglucosamine mutase [Pelagicoccus albus]
MKLRYFGTDGIRGQYGSESLNDEIAFRAGKAAIRLAREISGCQEPKIAVGRDTRESGVKLLESFASGVEQAGGKVMDLGVAPTPCVAYCTKTSDASLGCSITASHNPASDNGIKFFAETGVKPSQKLEETLDRYLGEEDCGGFPERIEPILEDASSLRQRYCEAVVAHFSSVSLKGRAVALDCANGAMFEIAPKVFKELGADVTVIGNVPDGKNINAGVGSEHPESLKSLYRKGNFDLGFAFDGDGDRLLMLDESGKKVPGEGILAVLATAQKKASQLKGGTLVTTIQSNLGLDAAMSAQQIAVARTDVGDKHVIRLMEQEGYLLGGEESGHVVWGRFAVTGDGLVAALALCSVLSEEAKPISQLSSIYQPFPQISIALRVASKPELGDCPAISACMKSLTQELGADGRILVRYSGTEPKIRLLVEARSQTVVEKSMDRLREAVGNDLEVL